MHVHACRDYMQSALFVCELESLHVNTSLSAFRSCKKEGLVRTLWRNHSHQPKVKLFFAFSRCMGFSKLLPHLVHESLQPLGRRLSVQQAVRLIAELSLYYEIGDGELWHRTLEKLLYLDMVNISDSLLHNGPHEALSNIICVQIPYLRYILKKLASSSQDLDVSELLLYACTSLNHKFLLLRYLGYQLSGRRL